MKQHLMETLVESADLLRAAAAAARVARTPMTRTPYDQLAKAVLEGALEGAGKVERQDEIATDPQWVDVSFERDAERALPPGVLGLIAERSCILEHFSDPPGLGEVRDCLRKQLALHQSRLVASRGMGATEPDLVPLWVLSTGRPASVIEGYELRPAPGWPAGAMTGAPALELWLVVISALERTRDTILLRLLGRGRVLQEALKDLLALPIDTWERSAAKEGVFVLGSLEFAPEDSGAEDITMDVRQLYQEDQARAEAKGEAKGEARGEAKLIGLLFERRLGRPLESSERDVLALRMASLGAARLSDLVLELDGDSLAAWLADAAAR